MIENCDTRFMSSFSTTLWLWISLGISLIFVVSSIRACKHKLGRCLIHFVSIPHCYTVTHVLWMKRLSAYFIMLSHGASCVAVTPPPSRGISYTQCRSERWVHACTSAPGNASPQRSRKVSSEGFIQRCSALGGNRLHWWLIYRINTKGIGFFSTPHPFLSVPLSKSDERRSTQYEYF